MKKLLLSLLFAATVASGAEVPANLIRAIHQVETSGRLGAIKGDDGAALGPFQIHKGYWLDATQYDKSIGGNYSKCAEYAYSVKVVTAYMNRYAKKYLASGNFEAVARIHNGGPDGFNKSATISYWKKVEKNLK